MKTILKTLITVPILLYIMFGAQSGVAQTTDRRVTTPYYKNAIGLRLGETSGLSFKHFFRSSNAVEVIVGAWPYSFGVTGLYENYIPSGVTGLNFYVGGGGHINAGYGRAGYYMYSGDNRYYVYRSGYPGAGIGIDGILGIEYKIPKVPFALSFDLKPFVEFNNTPDVFFALDPGLGIKFAF